MARMRLLHFVQILQGYLRQTVVYTELVKLKSALPDAKTLKEVIALHDTFVNRVFDSALQNPKAIVLRECVEDLLSLCIELPTLPLEQAHLRWKEVLRSSHF